MGKIVFGNKKPASQESAENITEKSYLTSSEYGNIYLDVLFKNADEKDKDTLDFEVMLDTHTEDLSEYYELDKFVELRVDGAVIKDGFEWKRRGVGHHVSGILEIKNSYQGKKRVDENTKELQLVFKTIGGTKERKHLYKL
jgi:hypothetical protein